MSGSRPNEGSTAKLQPGQQIEPVLTADTAKHLARQLYGFQMTKIKQLDSYLDKNYKLSVEKMEGNDYIEGIWEHGYVLKVLNTLDSKNPEFLDAQFAMMAHVRDHGMLTSRVVPQTSGSLRSYSSLSADGNAVDGEHLVYVLEYVPGTMLKGLPYTPHLMYSVGDFLGRLRNNLETFSHPGYKYAGTTWNLANFPDCKKFVYAIDDADNRQLILDVISDFEEHVLKSADSFQKGYIHQDFNEGNMLVQPSTSKPGDYEMCGIIDYGDSNYGCIIFDISVCLTYMILESNVLPPVECAGHALAGFLHHVKLTKEEKRVLRICIAGRMAHSLTLGAYGYQTQAEANDYLLLTAQKWPVLRELRDTSSEEISSTWRRVLGEYGIEWDVDVV